MELQYEYLLKNVNTGELKNGYVFEYYSCNSSLTLCDTRVALELFERDDNSFILRKKDLHTRINTRFDPKITILGYFRLSSLQPLSSKAEYIVINPKNKKAAHLAR